MTKKYRILRDHRAANGCPPVGSEVYLANDPYGLCNDDEQATGLEHIALSVNQSGVPSFTIPASDVVEV